MFPIFLHKVFTAGVAMVYNGYRKECVHMHKMDGDDLGYILAVIIVIILPLFFIISSCAHNSGNRGSYTSYESVEEVRDYGRAIYYEGRWQ